MSDEQRTHADLLEEIASLRSALAVAEAERARAEVFERIVNELPMLVCLHEPETSEVTYANALYCQAFGVSPEEVIGQTFWTRVSEDDRAHANAILNDLDPENAEGADVLRVQTPDGPRWHRWLARQRFDDEGAPLDCLAIGEDITAQRAIEVELQQARKLEAMGTLAGGIAHDFNNLLAIISLSADLGATSVDGSGPSVEHFEEIRDACDRGMNVVRQILTFSRTSPAVLRPVDIVDVCQQALKLVRVSTPHHIEVCFDAESELPAVLADRTQLEQVVTNLYMNALHAMESRQGSLRVTLSTTRWEGRFCVRLVVEDEGVGIPAENLERVFDPFFTTKKIDEGTGLGLSIVHGIVSEHGGTVSVESEVGRGTRVVVTLLATTDHVSREDGREDAPMSLSTRVEGHVLLVEDEAPLARHYQKVFRMMGCEVTVAEDGQQALELFMSNPDRFDLVFTDQVMPRMTGKEMSQAILARNPSTPIILCTGHSDQITEAEAIRIGIRRFLTKPTPLRVIRAEIFRLLGGHRPEE